MKLRLSLRMEVSVTTLIHRMREELVRRDYAATTIHSYLKAVEHFSQHVRTPLDQLGPDDGLMTEPQRNHRSIHTSLQQFHGSGVAKHVG
jgi:hypothetical protein